MSIKDVFRLTDGRTVLVGPVEHGENVLVRAGDCDVFVDDTKVESISIEPEMVPQRVHPAEFHEMRAVATNNKTILTKTLVEEKNCRLEGPMAPYGHRHLLGIDSPPDEFVPDDMTLGPRLPGGWDGDAWMRPGGGEYFLRAWHKATGRYAIGTGVKYEEARQRLLDEIELGKKRVLVTDAELGV